jgi:uncharacterized repeat protein (TIGR01451 family)
MSCLSGTAWRRRFLAAVALFVLASFAFAVANASADAGNPITGSIGGSVVVNPGGTNGSPVGCTIDGPSYCTVTVYVHGQWNWYSHGSDCNTDRAGAGLGIIWNDPTEPGFTVSHNPITQQVGIASLRAGDTVNKVDEMVHPSDLGNLAEGYPGLTGQTFNDPPVPAGGVPTNTEVGTWKGGCGREPLTATASPGPNAALNASGQTCADGTLGCNGHPWGSWGYAMNGGKGYSHTYAKLSDLSQVCVNFYDVHGGGNVGQNNFQLPGGTNEITVDKNGDNSIQTNAFDPSLGKNCFSFARTAPTVVTAIHNAAHQTITSSVGGDAVHDSVTVTGANGNTPTGNVTFDWFKNGTCTGAPAASSGAVALSGNGNTATADATAFAQTPTAGSYSFLAHYPGDGFYTAKDAACEPLSVVDGNIAITPASAINPTGTTHTLTITITPLNGTIDAGTYTATASLVAGSAGSFVGGTNTCTYTQANRSCTVVITSTAAGTSTVHATSTFSVAGLSVTRATGTAANTTAGGSNDATKNWVGANLSITPATAINAVNTNHTLTITVAGVPGGIDQGTYTATASLLAGSVGSFVGGVNTCTYTNTTPSCKVVITSPATGTSTVHAKSTFSVGGQSVTRDTNTAINTAAGGSGDAGKTWVDARISIAPLAPSNEVGKPHTFTVTVQQDTGTGNFTALSGATVTATLTDSNGAAHAAAAGTCITGKTDANGQCTIIVNSSAAGKVTVNATTTVVVSGQTITRSTGDGKSGDTADAVKTYVDAYLTISPASAVNPLNATHTYTVQFFTNDGGSAGYVGTNGVKIDFTLLSGHVGDFTGAKSCTTATVSGSAGICTITTVSSVAGQDTMQATGTTTVNGVSLTRTTGTAAPGHANSDNALKTWQCQSGCGGGGGGGTPAIAITKNPKSQTIPSGSTANFSITVTNTGTVSLFNVAVSDPLSPNCNQSPATIAALTQMGPGTSVSYNCSLGNVTASFTNVATATGTAPNGSNVTATDSAPVTVTTPPPPPPATPQVSRPAITIIKDPNSQTIGKGDTASFKITVRNSGDTALSNVTVSDPLSPDCNRSLGKFAIGQSKSYTCTKQGVLAAFTNVATATGKPPTGPNVQASDDAQVKVAAFLPPQTPRIAIQKSPKHQSVQAKVTTQNQQTTVVYGDAHFTIKVTNTGNVTLHDVVVDDPNSPDCNNEIGILEPGHSDTYQCRRETVSTDFRNIATASGISPKGVKVQATDHADVAVKVKTISTSGAHFTG